MSSAPVKARALFCPNCGSPVQLHGFGHTLTAACQSCLSVLDATTPALRIIQQVQESERRHPMIPLGTRGTFRGIEWEVIGFQTRGTDEWEWAEYVLFNPYKGFRYLTEYRGHWNFVRGARSLPENVSDTVRKFEGRAHKHFSTVDVRTNFVLGEFPWRVRVGDQVRAADYIAPPYILSAEDTADEITWSLGEYTSGTEIWQSFKLPGSPPAPIGIFANQPAPYKHGPGAIWRQWMTWLLALIALAAIVGMVTANREVFSQKYSFSPMAQGEPSFVTPVFELGGRTSSVEVKTQTNLQNDWLYINYALINEQTGDAFDFGREIGYFSGSDSDGSWTEGNKTDVALIPSVPPGRYYLRVEPEMDKASQSQFRGVNYEITVKRDVPSYSWFIVALFLLLIPPVWYTIRVFSFERARWAESDHALLSTSGSEEDDE